jgi:hypothetical protein
MAGLHVPVLVGIPSPHAGVFWNVIWQWQIYKVFVTV